MTNRTKEDEYRKALEKTRERLDHLEELYADKEIYSEFYELSGIVEKGLSNADDLASAGIDRLEDYLRAYSKDDINLIRDEKKQLVTAEEFVGLHQEKLAAERNNEEFTQTDLAALAAYAGHTPRDLAYFHKYAENLLGHPIVLNKFGDYEAPQKLDEEEGSNDQ